METTQKKLALGGGKKEGERGTVYSTLTVWSAEGCAPSSLLLEPGGQVSGLSTPVPFLRWKNKTT